MQPILVGAVTRLLALSLAYRSMRYGTEMARRPDSASLPMQEAGCKTRPVLLVWGGAPRRNRTGDPILTMNLALTAVRTSISAGRRRP
jgi:hypothetical protein